MKTVAFIGSDKNAGKTTVFNYIYNALNRHRPSVCLTSIGINGEAVDYFEGHPKPEINILKDTYFITAAEHLSHVSNRIEMLRRFDPPEFSKAYLFCKSKAAFKTILEGPNTGHEIRILKDTILKLLPAAHLLIDGSADRQFLAHPSICDAFYFSILLTDKKIQMERAHALLQPLSFSICPDTTKKQIAGMLRPDTKSILFDQEDRVIYHGHTIPFMDEDLKKACKPGTVLYLNGAFSQSLSHVISSFKDMIVILDNFTLLQDISATHLEPAAKILLFHPITVIGISIRRQTDVDMHMDALPFPDNIPVFDLFEDDKKKIDASLSYFDTEAHECRNCH